MVQDLKFWNWDQHGFPYWRCYWNDRHGAYIAGKHPVDLDPDHLILVPPHTPTQLRLDQPVRHLFIHFVVAPPFHHPREQVYRCELDVDSRRMVQKACDMLRERQTPALLPLRLLFLISQGLMRIPANCWQQRSMDARIHDTMLYIEQHMGRPLTVNDLAARVHLSEAAFARLFRASIGISPHRYILRRRVEMAAIHLGTSDLSIKQVALNCGFCDRYHFTRVFTQLMHTSPAAFRHRPRAMHQSDGYHTVN